jgi:hypothetical protein
MATWVSLPRAKTFPAVTSRIAYKKVNQFRKAVKAEAAGSAVWARRKTGFAVSNDANLEVDVAAITGVRPLFKDGAKKS